MPSACDSLDTLLQTLSPCYPDARGEIMAMFRAVQEILNCGTATTKVSCIQKVDPGIPPSRFIEIGWKGKIPDPITCPVLTVIRGCEMWMGVNSAACDLVGGTGWCAVCQQSLSDLPRAQININPGTNLSVSNAWTAYPMSGIDYDTGVGVVLSGGATQITLQAGTYLIDARFTKRIAQGDAPTNMLDHMRLWNVSLNSLIKTMQTWEFNSTSVMTILQQCRLKLILAGTTTIAFQSNNNPGTDNTTATDQGSDICIERLY